jgi:radical SAM superfamily enzyme YgiQ (UPF0313 family)
LTIAVISAILIKFTGTAKKLEGQLFGVVGRHVPPPPGLIPPARWGLQDHLERLFGAGAADIHVTLRDLVFRYRSPELVMREIDECVTRFGIREFLFHGDTFTLNKKWLLELCDRIIASGHRIHWGCNSRVDTLDEERAERMRRAGCWVVAFGVESGDQAILDKMRKGVRVERAREAVATCKRHGLRTLAFFVIGTPWETRQTLARTLEFVRELDTDFFDFNIAYPLPGTEMYALVEREGLFEQPPEGSGYASAAVRSHELSSAELTEWRKKALLSLYLRPKYIARMLARAGSPRVALNYVKAGARRLRQLVK